MTIREMTTADVPAGLRLCRSAHWNQTERDWQTFLAAAPHGALVAETQGIVIGSVATMPYGPFTWVSMVLVDPAARGRGIGTLLLERGLRLVPEGTIARLDATPAGEVLYRKLGFTSEYALARWFLDPPISRHAFSSSPRLDDAPTPRGTPRPFEPRDWPAVHEMDLRAFGAPRNDLLARFADEAPEYSWVLERESGGLSGFLFGRHGHVRDQLGPLVADAPETARVLLETCLDSHAGRAVFVDVPDDQAAWRHGLSLSGFRLERPFLRMHRGRSIPTGNPKTTFAISGPEFG